MFSTDSLIILIFILTFSVSNALSNNEEEAQKFADYYNHAALSIYKDYVAISWEQMTNITDYNSERLMNVSAKYAEWQRRMHAIVTSYDYDHFQNETLKRAFRKMAKDSETMNVDDVVEFTKLESTMTNLYSQASVCRHDEMDTEECLTITPGLREIMAKSRSKKELQWAWVGWREASGREVKQYYPRYVELTDKFASENGFVDPVEFKLASYEWSSMEEELETLWDQVHPLYQHLHAYVRRRLQEKYGLDSNQPHIPAHLLGNMWAQDWSTLYDLVQPYPDDESLKLDDRIIELNYTRMSMVKEAEKFFESLGLRKLPETFWTRSLFEKPKDRDVVCHASAWDMYDGDDVRIKMCISVNWQDFRIIHHELGHTYYQLGYSHLPIYFRESATPAFHEAIGDAITLSVASPKHLKKLDLIQKYDPNDKNATINFLLSSALSQVSFLPFGYIVDKWRWGVYRGETPADRYNSDWWKLRCNYQGIQPPVLRTEEHFDPGSKYHVASGSGYIQYFLSHILHFDLYKAMCKKAKHTGPLHTCDFDGSVEAGNLLRQILEAGTSRPWGEIMMLINEQETYSTAAILEYYQPLFEWLKKENEGYDIGWTDGCPEGLVSSVNRQGCSFVILCTSYLLFLLFR